MTATERGVRSTSTDLLEAFGIERSDAIKRLRSAAAGGDTHRHFICPADAADVQGEFSFPDFSRTPASRLNSSLESRGLPVHPRMVGRADWSLPKIPMTTKTPRLKQRDRSGGVEGNELLTVATAAVLTVLLAALGVTIVHMGGLVTAHMVIGLALLPPVALKLASTGYRFVRYYTGSRAYTAKGPPRLALRLLAPVLVVTTLAVFASGVLLLAAGHKAGALLEIHKVSFIVWGVVFGVHFLAYIARVSRSLIAAWPAARRHAVPGGGARGMLVAFAVGGGIALAVYLLPAIHRWQP
jgi:hypothetical protein